MSQASNALKFLRSFWGLLAAVTVVFPGAAALLNVPLAVEHSKIAVLYPVVGVIASAFAVLLATAYRERLFSLEVARTWAVTSMLAAGACFFGFIGVRVYLLDLDYKTEYVRRDGDELVIEGKSRGMIMERSEMKGGVVTAIPNVSLEAGDPWDILALALFTSSFSLVALSFSSLGLHVYEQERSEARSPKVT
jgi:hypothetical protein